MTSVNEPLGFARLMPGFDFMQQFAQAASGKGASAMNFTDWIAPTFSIEELDKRIEDLKAVLFWLEQNMQAIRATAQALEVQKMTLAALQSMNLNLADVAKAFTVPSASASEAAPKAEQDAGQESPDPAAPEQAGQAAAARDAAAHTPAPGMPDPLQWWGALTQQFQTIAANTLREVAQAVPPASAGRARRSARGAAKRVHKPAAKSASKSAAKTGAKSASKSTAKPATKTTRSAKRTPPKKSASRRSAA